MTEGKELLNVLLFSPYLNKDRRGFEISQGCVLRSISHHPMTCTSVLRIDHSNMQLSHTGIRRSSDFFHFWYCSLFSKPKHMLLRDSCACELPCYSICCQSGYCSLLFSFLFCMCLLFVLFFFSNYLTMKHFVYSYLLSYLA